MIGALSLLRHKPEHTVEQFRHHWRHVHGPLAAELHGVRRYVQSHFDPDDVLTNAFAYTLPVDGLAAISFDNEEDRSICYASRQEEICDVDSLLFIGASARYVTEVSSRVPGIDRACACKAVLLVTPAAPDLTRWIGDIALRAGVAELIAHQVTAPGATPTQARRQIDLPLRAIIEVSAVDHSALAGCIETLPAGHGDMSIAVFGATAHRIV